MAERRFEKRATTMGGQLITVRPVKCVECGQPGDIIDRTRGGLPSVQLGRMLKAKGWEIGASEKHDYCPKCVAGHRAERRARRVKPINNCSITSQEDAAMLQKAVTTIPPAVSETAPPEIGRAERRVIWAKLEEVYQDETAGYRTPWTDAAVAKDLGVPQAWVVAIREENFGPAADNSEIRDMLGRVKEAAVSADLVLREAKSIREDGARLIERINVNSKQASEISKSLSGLLAIAERIERSLKA